MDATRPVYWHEGLFLKPQHFQQQDLFHQTLVRELLSAACPYSWGVVALSISEPALANQVFEVAKAEVIFPDGALVRLPGNGRLGARSFEAQWDPSGASLAVYLGLKKLSSGGGNLWDGKSAEGGRYWVSDVPTPTQDLFVRGRDESLLYLDYSLRLFFGDEAARAGDYTLLKIAEVQRAGNEVRLAEAYVPPTVAIGGSPFLVRLLRELREKLTSRARDLGLYKGDQRAGVIDLGSRDFVYFVALGILNRYVPLLHHLSETPRAQPWAVYGLLRQIAGELSTLSSRWDALGRPMEASQGEGLPPYSHDAQGPCFQAATRLIFDLMEELVAGPDYLVRLLYDGTYYHADVSGRIFEGNNRYYLCARTSLPPEAVVAVLTSTAKLSSREYLPIVIARSLPGVTLEYLASPPAELPRRPDTVYLALDPVGPGWDAIRTGLNAAVYFDTPPGDIELELAVIYGK